MSAVDERDGRAHRADSPTLYERSRPGRRACALPASDVPATPLPAELARETLRLPELAQLDVVRHYTALAHRNFGVDSGFYPLGSCTMKYNPRLGEEVARLAGFAEAHPLADAEHVQPLLGVMLDLQRWLAELAGLSAVSLQPAAGAHGELTALLMMRAYHADRGEGARNRVLIPDSAHGTNPASTTMAGMIAVEIPSDPRGNVDLGALRAACDERVAGLMITNPNTLGLFEEQIEAVVETVHRHGGLVYGDGANMNALAGVVRPGDLGIDLMHFNLHKTFATPHGGGGPGSGPVAARSDLADYLPGPVVARSGEVGAGVLALVEPRRSIGRMCAFHGNFGMLLRAWAYLRVLGGDGLRRMAEHAVLNANYLLARLRGRFPVPYDRSCMHELVCEGRIEGSDVRALDICKRLLDHGIHPPTNYFPLIVHEALMIEPTETESRETLDAFLAALGAICDEAVRSPERLREAPHTTPVGRLDEVRAARHPVLVDAAVGGGGGTGAR
ncbi:MAG: aminomethyl-transferring glycine dehydrogenase subunit GcvPB [Ectothiorhodospiraceae bacterium]|nr:aminomethyl-transferring glycine dehydrogenase subunit GcvPB [Ectothiorhodospiraceae bacterium]